MALFVTNHDTKDEESIEIPVHPPLVPITPTLPTISPAINPEIFTQELQDILWDMAQEEISKQVTSQEKDMKKRLQDDLAHMRRYLSQAQKKFADTLKEVRDSDGNHIITPDQARRIARLLREEEETSVWADLQAKKLQDKARGIASVYKQRELLEKAWDDALSPQEAIGALCELVSKYIPADYTAAKASSFEESTQLFTEGRCEPMAKQSDQREYLKNTPIYRAVLLFRAAEEECNSRALCGRCPFKHKKEECKLWKFAFSLSDIAFYRAQYISDKLYEEDIAQKLTIEHIKLQATEQSLAQAEIQIKDLQSKLEKLYEANRNNNIGTPSKGDEDYETDIDPYLRFD